MAMELEYIFKILIMLIVVAVIIGLILTFRDQIVALMKTYLKIFSGNNQTSQFPKLIDKGTGTFLSGEVGSYVQSCYTAINSLQVSERATTNCYILRGNFNANVNDILQSITDSSLRTKVNITADFTKGAVVIEYLDPQGTILVK
jgi:hypothetical protein